MLARRLLNSYRSRLDRLEQDQWAVIDQAAEAVSLSLLGGGAWHVHDTGHIVDSELIHRSGGLMCIRPFSWNLTVKDPVPERLRKRPSPDPTSDPEVEAVRLAVRGSHIRRGDVMTIGSVSGRSAALVELALECRRLGCIVIVLSSLDFSSKVVSKHVSGKRLFECADIFIDNLAPYGDAHMTVEGLDLPVFPISGISSAVIMWLICAGVIERLVASGQPPQIWASVNIEGNRERNDDVASRIVDQRGF